MGVDPTIKILLVEDAGIMRKMEAQILGKIGFNNIVEAADGKEAVDKLQADSDIGLIISDWAMPNMDGMELLQWLRKQAGLENLPFLMATGHGDKEYVNKATAAGANGVVAKPFSPEELRVHIDAAFGVEQQAEPEEDEGPRVSASGKVKLKMAHIQITDHLALGVLKDKLAKGEQTAQHFDLETRCMASWNPVQKALEDGTVDGALILAPAAMDLFSYDVPIRLVLFAHRNGSICVRNKMGRYDEPYKQFWKHKSFLIPHKMSIHNMLAHMYFSKMGLRPGVAGNEMVNVLFDVVPPIGMPGFLGGNEEVAGFLVAEPIGSRAVAAGIAEQQFLSSEIWQDHPCCVVVMRAEFMEQYDDAAQEFVNLFVEAGKFISQHSQQAAEIAVSFLDPKGELNLSADLLARVLSDPQGITTDNLYPDINDLRTIQDYMTGTMGIGRPIKMDAFVNSKYADVACPSDQQGGDKKDAMAIFQDYASRNELASRGGKYLVFSLAEERYGLSILDVKEIIGMMHIHELPVIPPNFKGVINLRDKIIPVLSMHLKFGMAEKDYNERTCIIVVEVSGSEGSRLVGIIVDSVSDVAAIEEESIEDRPKSLGSSHDLQALLGVAKLSEGMVMLLDIDLLLQDDHVVDMGGS